MIAGAADNRSAGLSCPACSRPLLRGLVLLHFFHGEGHVHFGLADEGADDEGGSSFDDAAAEPAAIFEDDQVGAAAGDRGRGFGGRLSTIGCATRASSISRTVRFQMTLSFTRS